MEIEGKKIVVTGGANGIGKALVGRLMSEGAVVGVFDIDDDALFTLADEYRGLFCRTCDVSRADDVKTAVEDFYQTKGSIDVLVNNAGIVHNELLINVGKDGLQAHCFESWEKIIATNLSSTFLVTKEVVVRMVSKRIKGVIINVSSIAAKGNAGQSAYSASKAGINALTVTWAKELGNWGIRVAGIAPGFAKTETTIKSMSESTLHEWVKKTPTRRLATPDEIAEGILFIIKNDFFNGRILAIDGGLRL